MGDILKCLSREDASILIAIENEYFDKCFYSKYTSTVFV